MTTQPFDTDPSRGGSVNPIDCYCRYCKAIPGEECHASWSGSERDPAGRFHPGRVAAAEAVRLSVNIAPDVAQALAKWSEHHDVSLTEGVRRAIACWDFLEAERAKGNTFAVIETDGVVRKVDLTTARGGR